MSAPVIKITTYLNWGFDIGWVMENRGTLLSINISKEKGEKKSPCNSALVTERGLEGDAHAGEWHRQISLLAVESVDKMREACRRNGVEIGYGDFAENLTVKGIELTPLPIGQRIRVGPEVILEVTQIGKECHLGCAIREMVGDCVMPREGIFTRVVCGGGIETEDAVSLLG